MAKKPGYDKERAERRQQKDRRVNIATTLLLTGLIAELYLLQINRLGNGNVEQFLGTYDFLGVMRFVGAAAAAVGAALLAARNKNARFRRIGGWALGIGLFFALSSLVMRYAYPSTALALCILVPVAMLLGIICLLYQREFFLESLALAASIGAVALLSRSSSTTMQTCAMLALSLDFVLAMFTAYLHTHGGKLLPSNRLQPILPRESTDYVKIYLVTGVCFALVLIALLNQSFAFYFIWVLAALAFALAVYYTVKLL